MGIKGLGNQANTFGNKFVKALGGDSTGLDAVTPAPVPPQVEVLLAIGNDTTTNVSGAVSIPPAANTLWVFGAGGGGAGSRSWYGDNGGSGGSGAAVIWTAYPVNAVPLRGTSVPYQVGGGGGMSSTPGDGENGENGGATRLGPSGNLVNIGGGIGGGPGPASKSGGTLPGTIAPYGGSGGASGTGYPRGGSANAGASAATGGGGGGSGFNTGGTSGSAGGAGGSGDPSSSTRGLPESFAPGYVSVSYSPGGAVASGSWSSSPTQYPSGEDKLYAHGGGSAHSPAGGEHRGGGAGGGVRFTVNGSYVTNPGTQGPTDGYYGGGGGGGRSYSDQTYPPASGAFSGAGGGGCLIVLAEYA